MQRRIKTGNGTYAGFNDESSKVYESIEDWQEEGKRRFGPDVKNWKFVCPMCGHVAAVQDFIDHGVKDPANSAYEECLGRYTGKGSPKEGDSSGCNWAAYGLFGIPKGGIYIITGKDGEEETGAHIFDFAEESEAKEHGE